jgi:hypothetical protein
MNILPNTSLEDMVEHLDYLSKENFGSIREAHEHRIENAGWLYAAAEALSAEAKRLRSIVDDLYAYIVSDADISLKVIEEQMDWRGD